MPKNICPTLFCLLFCKYVSLWGMANGRTGGQGRHAPLPRPADCTQMFVINFRLGTDTNIASSLRILRSFSPISRHSLWVIPSRLSSHYAPRTIETISIIIVNLRHNCALGPHQRLTISEFFCLFSSTDLHQMSGQKYINLNEYIYKWVAWVLIYLFILVFLDESESSSLLRVGKIIKAENEPRGKFNSKRLREHLG